MTDEPLCVTMLRAGRMLFEVRQRRGELTAPEHLWLAGAIDVLNDIDSQSARPAKPPAPHVPAG